MKLLAWLFGCSHTNYSFPQTIIGRTYVVCLECGKEFAYDWRQMRVVTELPDSEREGVLQCERS